MPRLRLAERIGRTLRFSPEGRPVRVWIQSRPGEEDAVVVTGTVVGLRDRAAVVQLDEPAHVDGRDLVRFVAVPAEPGWGLEALWLAFIRVDAFAVEEDGERLGSWWLRLGRGASVKKRHSTEDTSIRRR